MLTMTLKAVHRQHKIEQHAISEPYPYINVNNFVQYIWMWLNFNVKMGLYILVFFLIIEYTLIDKGGACYYNIHIYIYIYIHVVEYIMYTLNYLRRM